MKADTLTLRDIFQKETRYVVPTFQRPYVWNEEEHWQLLWDDLHQVVEEFLAEMGEAAIDNLGFDGPEQSPHFLGAIVLEQRSTSTSTLDTREVIDGQQRLTTLQILLSAARDVALDEGLSQEASMLRSLIYNNRDLIREEEHQFKVWPIEPDRDAFRAVMRETDEGDDSRKTEQQHKIAECYRYFADEVRDWSQESQYSPKKCISALTTALWGLVRVVVIDLETLDDSQVIFETLNARGTPLLAGDLVKNFLLRQADHDGLSADELHQKYWEQFDEDEWREEVVQGRLERPRIDVFLTYWLTMRTASRVRAKKLFPTFQNYLKTTDNTVEDVLIDIDHYARVYETFSAPYSDDREGVFFKRLDVLDTTTPIPVLLWLYGDESIPPGQRRTAVEAIESWLVRRMLCRVTTKNYNRIFLELLSDLQDSEPENVASTVIEFFKDKEGASEYWPTDEEVRQTMVEKPYWSRINQRRLRMVFRAFERELRDTGYSEGLEISQKLHIEHILPREWAHHWDLPGADPEEVERIERDEVKHTVGNLTILTEKLNPTISNAAWDTKREAIDDHSVLLLNRRLIDRWHNNWDENTIAERGRWLSELAVGIWPGPTSNHWQ